MNLLKIALRHFYELFFVHPFLFYFFENKELYLRMYKFIRKAKLYLNEMEKNSRFFMKIKKGRKLHLYPQKSKGY
jgi:hypothetical protein